LGVTGYASNGINLTETLKDCRKLHCLMRVVVKL